jgi:hypothetical protein
MKYFLFFSRKTRENQTKRWISRALISFFWKILIFNFFFSCRFGGWDTPMPLKKNECNVVDRTRSSTSLQPFFHFFFSLFLLLCRLLNSPGKKIETKTIVNVQPYSFIVISILGNGFLSFFKSSNVDTVLRLTIWRLEPANLNILGKGLNI